MAGILNGSAGLLRWTGVRRAWGYLEHIGGSNVSGSAIGDVGVGLVTRWTAQHHDLCGGSGISFR